MRGDFLGRIDCPYCGTSDGMKIIEDRAGSPFGHCDVTCNGQLRIGDKHKTRIGQFYRKYTHINKVGCPVTVTGNANPVTVTADELPVTVTDENEAIVHGAAAATTEPRGGQLPVIPKKKTYAEELALLVGGMRQ